MQKILAGINWNLIFDGYNVNDIRIDFKKIIV